LAATARLTTIQEYGDSKTYGDVAYMQGVAPQAVRLGRRSMKPSL